ncbi:MAG TPA: hypothetical protein VEX35_11810 [Allosphingosinicella sp.]|nr:hypothetical protein [Allosphingosinicella sp.]
MKIAMTMLAATALVLVPACSNQPAPANNVAAPTNEAAGPGIETGNGAEANLMLGLENQASVIPEAAALDRAALIGRWGNNGDCARPFGFNADGSGGPPEGTRWSLTGDRLSVTRPGQAGSTSTLVRTGENSIRATREDGAFIIMTRCP